MKSEQKDSVPGAEQYVRAVRHLSDAIAAASSCVLELAHCRQLTVPLHELYQFYSSSAGSLQMRTLESTQGTGLPPSLLRSLGLAMLRYASVLRVLAAQDGAEARAKHAHTLAGVLVT